MAGLPERVPPSPAAIAIGTALISGVTGYYLGQARSIGLLGGQRRTVESDLSDADEEDEQDDEEESVTELKAFPHNTEECKMVLIVRTDLGMTKGKIAAQCSHATLACYKNLIHANPSHPLLQRWERLGQAKIALKVDSEDEMLVLQAQALSLGLCACVIHDAGRTQIASGSATVLGIGPGPKNVVDEVTGHLRLL